MPTESAAMKGRKRYSSTIRRTGARKGKFGTSVIEQADFARFPSLLAEVLDSFSLRLPLQSACRAFINFDLADVDTTNIIPTASMERGKRVRK